MSIAIDPTRAARHTLALLALLASAPVHAQPAAPDTARARAIEQARAIARAALAADSLPGLSVAVGVDGQVVWAEGFGWADRERRDPVTPATRFRAGSVGKTFTAAAAALLHERGRLDLDAPVRRLVPAFPEKEHPVTTRQLLSHLGGIRHYRTENEVLGARHCADVAEGLAAFAADSLVARPGTRYHYSSYGYALAGAAVQAAAGEPYAAFVRREILAPLGMSHTLPEPPEPLAGRATPYVRSSGLAPAPQDHDSCVLPAGGFLSTPSDLVRWGFGMLDARVLRPETVRLLWTPQATESGESTGYGLGWFVRSASTGADRSITMVGHGGSSVGGTTSFMVFPEQRVVVSVVTNVSNAGTTAIAGRIAGAFLPRAPR